MSTLSLEDRERICREVLGLVEVKGVGWYHAEDAEAYRDGDTGVLFMTPHFEGYAPDLTVEDIWMVRDAHWQDLLQYDEDPETAGLNILERVKRLSNLIGFVDGSPSWKAILGHLLAVSGGRDLLDNVLTHDSIAVQMRNMGLNPERSDLGSVMCAVRKLVHKNLEVGETEEGEPA